MIDKQRLQNLFEQYKLERSQRTKRDSVVMVVDGLNLFIRAFAANPTMNVKGEHIGGLLGFLKSLFFYIRKFNPTRVIVVFDGKDGAKHRRALYPEYKGERRVKDRFNRRSDINGIIDEEQSCIEQLNKLDKYLEYLPFDVFILNYLEGDDVISYIVSEYYSNKDVNKIYIISTDKDFLQLVSDVVNVYSPTSRKLYDMDLLKSEYGMSPNNYLIYRTLRGDSSDNISGVRGAGKKTILKLLPEILGDDITIDDLINIVEKKVVNGSKYKLYRSILENRDTLKLNWDLMQLRDVDIPVLKKMQIKNALDDGGFNFDAMEFRRLITNDGLIDYIPNYQSWIISSLNDLEIYARTV